MGELLITSDYIIKRYWNNPEETARSYVEVEGETSILPLPSRSMTRCAAASPATERSAPERGARWKSLSLFPISCER